MINSLAKSSQIKALKAVAVSLFVLAAAASLAQTPVVAPAHVPISRLDLYGGYGYLHPVDSGINGFQYQPINPGAVASVSGYFSPHFGVQAEGSFFPHGPNDCVYTAQAGPIARLQKGRFVPFAHALVGGAKVGGPAFQSCTWGWGVTGGVGFDYVLPGFHDHLAIRPIQADFEFSQVTYGPLVLPAGVTGGQGNLEGYRLSGGIVLRFGDMVPPPPVTAACSVQPDAGYPGDPILATITPGNLSPKRHTTYSWTSTSAAVSVGDPTLKIPTQKLAPGAYSVTGHVSQGQKPAQSASCTTSFTVRDFEPPTISCSADPSTVVSGATSTITAVAMSPQNRALTYSYTAPSGQISGTDKTAVLSTVGAAPGPITVTCNVVDDRGKSATATTTVTVSAPEAPAKVIPTTDLCSVSFDRDLKRPARVNNEAKACLDDLALSLQRQTDAKLVIVGNHTESENDQMAAERAANVREYLTIEKGIDANRLEIRIGSAGTRTVTDTLVPLGAVFAVDGTTVVDPASVKHHGQSYGKPKSR